MIDWEIVTRVSVAGGFTLEQGLLFPNFDYNSFPFLLDYGTSPCKLLDYDTTGKKKNKSFDLINLKSGTRTPFILGSA